MIGKDVGVLVTVVSGLALVQVTITLDCYICGDDNLDEYGDCRAQFHYDCTSYAKSFEPGEAIFCRTMRKRVRNGTYTIMKECISERDHYRTFPPKQHPLDEECDLIDIDGEELAYCLCRQNLCNSKNIVDQFIDFEEMHPEIFGSANDDTNKPVDKTERFPVSTKDSVRYSQIRTAHQDEANIDRRTRRPAISAGRFHSDVEDEYSDYVHMGSAPKQTHTTTQSSNRVLAPALNYDNEPAMYTGHITPDVKSGQSGQREDTDNDARKFAIDQTAAFRGVKQQNIEEEDYCYSCMEDLKDPTKDCAGAVAVQCTISRITGRSQPCITKQSRAANNLYRLEKRCSTDEEQQEIAFGEVSSRKITCTATVDGAQAYCLCLGQYCNKESLLAQAEKEAQSIRNSVNFCEMRIIDEVLLYCLVDQTDLPQKRIFSKTYRSVFFQLKLTYNAETFWNKFVFCANQFGLQGNTTAVLMGDSSNSTIFSGNSDVIASAGVIQPLPITNRPVSRDRDEELTQTTATLRTSSVTSPPTKANKSISGKLIETKRLENRWKDIILTSSARYYPSWIFTGGAIFCCVLSVLITSDLLNKV